MITKGSLSHLQDKRFFLLAQIFKPSPFIKTEWLLINTYLIDDKGKNSSHTFLLPLSSVFLLAPKEGRLFGSCSYRPQYKVALEEFSLFILITSNLFLIQQAKTHAILFIEEAHLLLRTLGVEPSVSWL